LKSPVGGLRSYAGALVIVLSTVAIYTAVTQLAIGHDMSGDMGPIAAILRGPWWPLAMFVIAIGAPISEELLFRGFLLPALVPTPLGYWGAAAVSSAAWSALHAGYSIVGLIEVFMIGMIFSYALRRTGSLRVPLACHAIYNALVSAIVIIVPKETLGF
jgi:hypothetical protein